MIKPNNIYHGDCYELIKQIPDKSVDLVITDPPYKIEGIYQKTGIFKYREFTVFDELADKKLDIGIDYSILDELVRVLKYIYIYIYGATKNKCLTI